MARIVRKLQKIFALNATNNGQFGSGQLNTKVTSSNLDTLQALAAYSNGWLEATLSARDFPPLEEFQGLMYIATSQLAYMFQEGIPEWNTDTTYYQKSIVKQTGTYQLYGSLTDNNMGNALTDNTKWVPLIDLSTTIPHATTSVYGTTQLATDATDIVRGTSSTNVPTATNLVAHGFVTGDWKGCTLSALQDGWIWAAGTIGDASSNATNRANSDTLALFTAYWQDSAYNYTGTTATGAALQVYDFSGNPVAKGANAAADYAAHRTIAVPDYRDRVPAGRGTMVGSAGRLSGQPGGVNGNSLGNSGGGESHTLTIAQMPNHGHYLPNTQNTTGPGGFPSIGGRPWQSGDVTNYTSAEGGGLPHNNVQPTIITNIIIKL